MNLDWKNLGFKYLPTRGHVVSEYRDGKWGDLEFRQEPQMSIHIAATALHYGQACFEGLKAFRTWDGRAVLMRPDRNAARLQMSASQICMQAPSESLFVKACRQAVRENLEFLPPYGTGASMYVRPLLIGTQAAVGLVPSETFTFLVLVTPVGPYYKDGFHPVEALVVEEYDRAAPYGTGRAKVGGNYAAGLAPGLLAKEKGYPIVLFTDSREHKYIDEFGTSNFIGITGAGEYKTPESPSILRSITNESLQALAESYGMKVVRGPLELEAVDEFDEVGACGTAAVITPIYSITRGEKKWTFGKADAAGATLTRLYEHLTGIQYGEKEDLFGWLTAVD
jgi:branched-chain amino acid aminotransferase